PGYHKAILREQMIVSHRAQIAVVRIKAFGRLAHGALDLCLFEFRCNRTDHARRHSVLKLEDVFEDAVKMVSPKGAARCRVDELAANAQTVRRFSDAAFEHIPHTQLAADLLYICSLALVGEARIAGDHKQRLEA